MTRTQSELIATLALLVISTCGLHVTSHKVDLIAQAHLANSAVSLALTAATSVTDLTGGSTLSSSGARSLSTLSDILPSNIVTLAKRASEETKSAADAPSAVKVPVDHPCMSERVKMHTPILGQPYEMTYLDRIPDCMTTCREAKGIAISSSVPIRTATMTWCDEIFINMSPRNSQKAPIATALGKSNSASLPLHEKLVRTGQAIIPTAEPILTHPYPTMTAVKGTAAAGNLRPNRSAAPEERDGQTVSSMFIPRDSSDALQLETPGWDSRDDDAAILLRARKSSRTMKTLSAKATSQELALRDTDVVHRASSFPLTSSLGYVNYSSVRSNLPVSSGADSISLLQWSGEVLTGHPHYNLAGTSAQDLYHQIKSLNSSYFAIAHSSDIEQDFDMANCPAIMESGFKASSTFGRGCPYCLEDGAQKVTCSYHSQLAEARRIVEGLDYLRSIKGMCRVEGCLPNPKKGITCEWGLPEAGDDHDNFRCVSSRVSCSHGTAIYMVNCNSKPWQMPCEDVGAWAADVNSRCCHGHAGTDMCDNARLDGCAGLRSGGIRRDRENKHYVDVRRSGDLGDNC